MTWEFHTVHNTQYSSGFFLCSGYNTERIWQIIFWYDFDESSLSAIYKVGTAHLGKKCSYCTIYGQRRNVIKSGTMCGWSVYLCLPKWCVVALFTIMFAEAKEMQQFAP